MLYIVATPIGNLKEITTRAIETLSNCDYILCEDTRTSKVLLNSLNIKKRCVAYHKFNESSKVEQIVEDLKQDKNIALISDAGMPCISDPGNILVNSVIKNNLKYTVISGATALINAFVLSGYSAPFTFIGFLPDKNSTKNKLLNEIKNYKTVLIFYISPHNLPETLKILSKSLGNRDCVVVREISKMYEEVYFTTLTNGYDGILKGEFVVVVNAPQEVENPLNSLSIEAHLKHYLKQDKDKGEAIKQVCKDRNLKKNDVYKIAITIK